MIWNGLHQPKKCASFVVISAVLGTLAAASTLAEVAYAFGFGNEFLFADPNDLFGDLIKSALSYKSVVGGLLHSPQILTWPEVYRDWLYNNPYNGPVLTHYHLLPLTTVFKLLAAEIIVIASPTMAYVLAFAIYMVLIVAAMRILAISGDVRARSHLALIVVLLISHPALFMLTRGNLASGYMSIFILIYCLTAISGRDRNFGLFCLAAAINIHPNTAAVGLLEISCAVIRKRDFIRSSRFLCSPPQSASVRIS